MWRFWCLMALGSPLTGSCGQGVYESGERPETAFEKGLEVDPSVLPIVFVHGFAGKTMINLSTLTGWFEDDGWPAGYLHTYNYDSFSGVIGAASRLATEIEAVLERTGAAQVDIVAHSMGGLVARFYLNHLFEFRADGQNPVRRTVTLGAPHAGTNWAYTCGFLQSCRDMQPGSRLLEEEVGGCAGVLSIWSSCDEIVLPNRSAVCGEPSWRVGCLEHLALCWSWPVYEVIREYLR